MDSLICLWDKSIVKCENLLGHGLIYIYNEKKAKFNYNNYRGSISKIMVDEYNIGISASYDCSMIIW